MRIKRLAERLTNFLKRKREDVKLNISIVESETSDLLSKAIKRELESMLKDPRYRKVIRDISR